MNASTRTTVPGALAILVLTCIAYLPVLHCGFVWDDDDHVTNNQTLRSPAGLVAIWLEPGNPMQYYPLTFTAWWAQYHLWGLNPTGYHVANVLLHILNALLFWRLLTRWEVPGAWLAAAVFALHPVNVMSVAWITELKNVFSGAFFLGAALAYDRYARVAQPVAPTGQEKRGWYWIAVTLYVCALLSKTATALLPVALFLALWWKRERLTRCDLLPLVPLVIAGGLICLITVWVEKMRGATGAEFALSFAERVLVAGRAFWFYLGKLLWPTNLAFIYPRWQLDTTSLVQWLYPVALVVLLITLWLTRKRVGKAPFAALLYFFLASPALVLVLVLYMTRYAFVTDHWQYLGSLSAIPLMIGCVLGWWKRRRFSPKSGKVAAGILLLILMLLTYRQAGTYHDLETLWTDTLSKNPDSWLAHNNLGTILHNQGKLDDAVAHYREALRIKPDSTDAHNNLGLALATKGDLDEALTHLREALRLKPDFALAHLNLGRAYRANAKPEEAARHLGRAVVLMPDNPEAHVELAEVYQAQGKLTSAVREFSAALKLRPDFPEARLGLGSALESLDRLDDAVTEYAAALGLRPDYAEAHNNLGMVFLKQGKPDQAIEQFIETLRLLPGYPAVRVNLGLALMARRQYEEARREFREALVLDPKLLEVYCNLAEAFVIEGRIEEAREQQRAVQSARPDLAAEIGKKIEAYQAGHPTAPR